MRRLVLRDAEFKSWEIGLKRPILGALSALANPANKGLNFRLTGLSYQLPRTSNVPCEYFELVRSHLASARFPMHIRDMLTLVKEDQSFRTQNHWRKLSELSSRSRRPRLSVAREGWDCRQALRHLFDYSALRSGKALLWNGQTLTLSTSGVDMLTAGGCKLDAAKFVSFFKDWNEASYCPYCNAETIYSEALIEDPKRAVRSDLDHFLPQWQYPYFAVSPYNLIPSCTRCNSRMKHDDDPIEHKNLIPKLKLLYPYLEDFHELASFKFKNPSVELLSGDAKEGDLELACEVSSAQNGNRAEESARQFCLRTVYQRIYQRELRSLPLRLRVAASSYAEDMAQFLRASLGPGDVNVSPDRIRAEILGITFQSEKIDDIRFGKLCVDLGKQLGFDLNYAN